MQRVADWQRAIKRYQRHFVFRGVVLSLLVIFLLLLVVQSVSTNQVVATDIDRNLVLQVSLDSLRDKFDIDCKTGWSGWASDNLGLDCDSDLDYEDRRTRQQASLIADVRWPRVVIAVLVGASLALAGTVMQAVFRNPLADPGLIGVSSGAAMGAITAILLQLDLTQVLEAMPVFLVDPGELSGLKFAQTLMAFGIGLLMTMLVFRLSRAGGRTDTANLLLVGLAVNSIAGAYVGLATYIGSEAQSTDIIFWSLGSVAGTSWNDVYLVLPFVLLGVIFLPFYARQLNIMTLGEDEARNLGVDTERLRRITVAISALMVGVAVGFAGIIGFIGLVVPHVMRLLFGPDHRIVLPASIVGGAIFLVVADIFGRTLPNPALRGFYIEVPVGILTALVGGPIFLLLVLLHQMRRTRS